MAAVLLSRFAAFFGSTRGPAKSPVPDVIGEVHSGRDAGARRRMQRGSCTMPTAVLSNAVGRRCWPGFLRCFRAAARGGRRASVRHYARNRSGLREVSSLRPPVTGSLDVSSPDSYSPRSASAPSSGTRHDTRTPTASRPRARAPARAGSTPSSAGIRRRSGPSARCRRGRAGCTARRAPRAAPSRRRPRRPRRRRRARARRRGAPKTMPASAEQAPLDDHRPPRRRAPCRSRSAHQPAATDPIAPLAIVRNAIADPCATTTAPTVAQGAGGGSPSRTRRSRSTPRRAPTCVRGSRAWRAACRDPRTRARRRADRSARSARRTVRRRRSARRSTAAGDRQRGGREHQRAPGHRRGRRREQVRKRRSDRQRADQHAERRAAPFRRTIRRRSSCPADRPTPARRRSPRAARSARRASCAPTSAALAAAPHTQPAAKSCRALMTSGRLKIAETSVPIDEAALHGHRQPRGLCRREMELGDDGRGRGRGGEPQRHAEEHRERQPRELRSAPGGAVASGRRSRQQQTYKMTRTVVTRPLLIIFLTIFVNLIGFGIIIPLLPFYAETFGALAARDRPAVRGLLDLPARRGAGARRLVGPVRPASGADLQPARAPSSAS